ncbi:hypothetical protein KGY58_04440 [Candidatus Bipolaricaulota bacterium]|nr:hypothetical protein [Candidatus Bipolaricaulota bacterium]MBS3825771.1 hypothetical protein [Candidatus Bipolaricaulota bacterium]
MKSVRQLKDILGLNTIHQTRNRIKAVEDVIQPYIKRGENNEILVGDEGVTILTKLQDLYESGLLLSEAAEVIRSDYLPGEEDDIDTDSYSTTSLQPKPKSKVDLIDYLMEELEFQRELILNLARSNSEGDIGNKKVDNNENKWWLEWL